MKFVFVESSRRAWGSEQHFVDLAIGCQAAGHRVEAVVRVGSDVANLLQDAGIVVHATPFRGGADPRAMRIVWKAVRAIQADWIVTNHLKHYWPLYVIARASGTRLAVFRHMAYIRNRFTRAVFPRVVDRFFVVSQFARDRLVADGACGSRVLTLYNPIDLNRFVPDPDARRRTRTELDLPLNAPVVGFIGRHDVAKGVPSLRLALAHAMHHDPDLHAVWVGEGPEWQSTRDSVAAGPHASRHRFVPWTEAVERYYVALDCLVCPSEIEETFGRVLAEAQACGVPVIARDRGGFPEAFAPSISGLLWSDGDPFTLSTLMLELLHDALRRAAMGQAGRSFVQRFSTPNVIAEFERMLRDGAPAAALSDQHFHSTSAVRTSADDQSIPLFQQLAGGDPLSGVALREESTVIPKAAVRD
jgi:glycosyltransferase involved in cell wall biosynthesis